jgi:outer membrane protein assembly factor BamE (lipoprotein component of BamABCDE complex)
VLAVYFDDKSQVARVANYGLKDGQIVDFVTRTTPTGGKDFSFLSQLFSATGVIMPQAPSQ